MIRNFEMSNLQSKHLQSISPSYTISSSPSFSENELLPALDYLSEEERQKIMAVMASAELDAASTNISEPPVPVKISASCTVDSFFNYKNQRFLKFLMPC